LWVVSLTDGAVYEIFRASGSGNSPSAAPALLRASQIITAPATAQAVQLDVLTVEVSPRAPASFADSMIVPVQSLDSRVLLGSRNAREFFTPQTSAVGPVSWNETGVVDDLFAASPAW